MSYYINPIEEDRCLYLTYEGVLTTAEAESVRQKANALLGARRWNRVVVDVTLICSRLQTLTPSSSESRVSTLHPAPRMSTYSQFRLQLGLLALLAIMPSPWALSQESAADAREAQAGQMPYFDAVPDPIEGFNRCSWEANDWLFRGVIYPLSFGYNAVAPKPIRTHISNVGHNLTYPVRLFNNCLQGKWGGAWEETKRFGANSTVGLGGFFDPATRWRIGRSDEDFGRLLATAVAALGSTW